MSKPHLATHSAVASETVPATESLPLIENTSPRMKWEARHHLDRHRAETERLRVLVDFLARPIHAHGGSDPDPDIITAYNLAVEAALQRVRQAACLD